MISYTFKKFAGGIFWGLVVFHIFQCGCFYYLSIISGLFEEFDHHNFKERKCFLDSIFSLKKKRLCKLVVSHFLYNYFLSIALEHLAVCLFISFIVNTPSFSVLVLVRLVKYRIRLLFVMYCWHSVLNHSFIFFIRVSLRVVCCCCWYRECR